MVEEHELVDRFSPTVTAQGSEQEVSGLTAVAEAQRDSQAASIASNVADNSVEEPIESDTAALLMRNGTTNDEAAHEQTDSVGNQELSRAETHALQARNKHSNIFSVWWLEILACAISISALIATFATLYAYADQPSPDWPSWLSLNALIAIYIVLLKSGVLLIAAEGIGQLKWSWFAEAPRSLLDMVKYDDATRGPVGASILLWKLKGGRLVASLGALVTILALIVDPFTQQIIRYYDCSIPVDGAAQIPRTNYYHGFGGYHLSPLEYSMSPGIQSAVNQGVFNPSRSPWSQCTTGNCTWDSEYSTLGWCSSCREITNQLTIRNMTYEHVHIVVMS